MKRLRLETPEAIFKARCQALQGYEAMRFSPKNPIVQSAHRQRPKLILRISLAQNNSQNKNLNPTPRHLNPKP